MLFAIAACGSSPSRPTPIVPSVANFDLVPAINWLGTLAKDDALPSDWVDAAERIAMVEHHSETSATLAGEVLRSHASPSVTEALEKRIATTDLTHSCRLATALLVWDRKAGLAVAQRKLRESIARGGDCTCIGPLTVELVRAKQFAAADEYARWIATSAPSPSGAGDDTCFLPLQRLPHSPALAKAAEQVFRDGSAWVPLVAPGGRGHMTSHFMLGVEFDGDPLITVTAFNRHVAKALDDCRTYGTLTVGDGTVTIEQPDETSTLNEDGATAGAQGPMRVCDFYANALSAHDTAPEFRLHWSVPQRDAALPAFRAWLPGQITR